MIRYFQVQVGNSPSIEGVLIRQQAYLKNIKSSRSTVDPYTCIQITHVGYFYMCTVLQVDLLFFEVR